MSYYFPNCRNEDTIIEHITTNRPSLPLRAGHSASMQTMGAFFLTGSPERQHDRHQRSKGNNAFGESCDGQCILPVSAVQRRPRLFSLCPPNAEQGRRSPGIWLQGPSQASRLGSALSFYEPSGRLLSEHCWALAVTSSVITQWTIFSVSSISSTISRTVFSA